MKKAEENIKKDYNIPELQMIGEVEESTQGKEKDNNPLRENSYLTS